MFDSSHCAECKTVDCMMKCQWIDFESIETAKQEITKLINEDEDCRILKECMLCFSCDEYCTYNSHPFDKINELQEKYQSQDILPAIVQKSIDMYKAKGLFVPRPIDPAKPILNKCAFPKMNAKEMKGPMFDGLQSVGGLHYFCQLVYQHVAKPSIIAERLPVILENFKKTGVLKETEVICWHDECLSLIHI